MLALLPKSNGVYWGPEHCRPDSPWPPRQQFPMAIARIMHHHRRGSLQDTPYASRNPMHYLKHKILFSG